MRDDEGVMTRLSLLLLLAGCMSGPYGARPVQRKDACAPQPPPASGTESYGRFRDNRFHFAATHPLSTFSIDVDTASYANVRRFLNDGRMPPVDAVRIEELVNYFPYDYAPPADGAPFAVRVDAARCPWADDHRLVRISLKAGDRAARCRPPANLVFLLDVSGSMADTNKLGLVKGAMRLLVKELGAEDRVAIVTYRDHEELALPATRGDRHKAILRAIDGLDAHGRTNGGAGIDLAYRVAEDGFRRGGANRVILATDGDFNVGVTDGGDLARLIEEKARGGVFLTVLGFGEGNLKDATLESLADRGNGAYAYVDTLDEARKILVEEAAGTLLTVAKDVKVQVEFNPARVASYRLLGYENRALQAEDFNDDREDAGEMGAGHGVTALYEVIRGGVGGRPAVDPLRYEGACEEGGERAAPGDELLYVKVRWKEPRAETSRRISVPLLDGPCGEPEGDFRFAAAVACWGLLLRESEDRGCASYGLVRRLASSAQGGDAGGYREEFLSLVQESRELAP
ncbi:MAG TPA: VWA domain-containing protein [Planctomycetota bacterium]|nr:VWA domain-containing protein [Planctomycetota bacterium]